MDNELDKQQKIENKFVFEQIFLNNLIKIIKSQSCLNDKKRINKVISEISNDSFLSKISIDWEKYLSIFFYYLDQMKKLLEEDIEIVKNQIEIINKQKEFELDQLDDNLINSKKLLEILEDNYLSKLESLDDFNYKTFGEELSSLASKFIICLNSCYNLGKFSNNNDKICNYFLKISDSTWTPYLTFCKDKIDKLFSNKNINFYKGLFYIYVNRDSLNKDFDESISSIVALFLRQLIDDLSICQNKQNPKIKKIQSVLEAIHNDELVLENKNIETKPSYDFLKEKLEIIFNNKKKNYENIFSIINNMFNEYIHRNIKIQPDILTEVCRHFHFLLHNHRTNSNNFEFTMHYYLFIYKIFIPYIKIKPVHKDHPIKYRVNKDKLCIINEINKNKLNIQDRMNKFVKEITNKINNDSVLNNQCLIEKETEQLWNNFKLNKDKYFDWEKDSIEVLFKKYKVLYSEIIKLINNAESLKIYISERIDQLLIFDTVEQLYKDPNFIEIVDQFLTCYEIAECLLSTPFLFILYALLLDNKITKEIMNEALNYTLFTIKHDFLFLLIKNRN